jgi:hypothetical protein
MNEFPFLSLTRQVLLISTFCNNFSAAVVDTGDTMISNATVALMGILHRIVWYLIHAIQQFVR